jgi:hypothetical protein
LQNALNAKLSLSGGTMTGALSGTSATFSSTVTIPAITGSSNLIYVAQNQTFSWEYDSTNTNPALRFTWGGAATTLWGSSSAVNISVQGTNGFRVAAGTTNLAGTLGLGSVSSPTAFLRSDGSNTIDIRNSTNAQRLNLYGTYTDASNYRRVFLSSTTAGEFRLGVDGAGTGATGNRLRFSSGDYDNTSYAISVFDTTRSFLAFGQQTYSGSPVWSFRAGNGHIMLADADNGCSILASGQNSFAGNLSLAWGTSGSVINYKCVFGFRNTDAYLAVPLAFGRQGTSGGVSNTHEGAWVYGEATDVLALRRSTNAQRFNLYGTYTDASNYRRLYLSSTTAGAFTLGVEGAGTGASGNTLTVANDLNISGLQITLGDSTHWLYNSVGTGFGLMFSGFGSKLTFNGNFILTGRYTNHELYVGHQNARIIYGTQSYTNTDTNRVIVQAVDGLHIRNTPATTSATAFLYNTFTDASNYIRQSLSFTTYSSTVHAQLAAQGAGTGAVNVPFVITPRGTGAFIVGPMPDGTATGGNARGAGAVDIQTERNAATQVASNSYLIAIGSRCTATGNSSGGTVAIGRNVNVSDSLGGAFGAGLNTTVTGYRGVAIGAGATAGADSIAIGTGSYASNNNAICIAGSTSRWNGTTYWKLENKPIAQSYLNSLSGSGFLSTTPTIRTTNSSSQILDVSITSSFIASRQRHRGAIIYAKFSVFAVRSDGAINKYDRRVVIKDVASLDGTTSTLSILATDTIGTDITEISGASISIVANSGSKTLQINVTGEPSYVVTGNSTTDVLTAVGHPFANNDIVVFTAITGGAGLSTNINGVYYEPQYKVINVSGNDFQLTAVGSGTTPINFTTDITAGTICRPIVWSSEGAEFHVIAGGY